MEKGISYTTKSFITGNFTIGLIMVLSLSMSMMFLFVMLGLPIMLTTVLFIGSIVLFIALLAGNTEYTITKEGISRKVSTMLSNITGLTREQSFKWDEIEWYETGSDLNRSMREYNYLTIKFKGIGNQWKISDSAGGRDAFIIFGDAFVKLAEAFNDKEQPIGARVSNREEPRLERKAIKRKKSFYETIFAKVFTVATTIFLACLIAFYFFNPQYLKGTHVSRISLILLPGLSYLLYRTFIKKN